MSAVFPHALLACLGALADATILVCLRRGSGVSDGFRPLSFSFCLPFLLPSDSNRSVKEVYRLGSVRCSSVKEAG